MSLKRKDKVVCLLFVALSLFAIGVAMTALRDASFISEVYKELFAHNGHEREPLIKLIGEILLENIIAISLGISCIFAISAVFSETNKKRLAGVSVFCGFIPFIYETTKAIPLFSVDSNKLWTLPVGIVLIICLTVSIWLFLNRYLVRGGELKYSIVFLTASCFIRAIPTNSVRSFHIGELSFFRAEWVSLLFFGCGAFTFLALFFCENSKGRVANEEKPFKKPRYVCIITSVIFAVFLVLASVLTALSLGIKDYFIQNGAFILGAVIFVMYLLFCGRKGLLLISVCLIQTIACPSLYVIYERSLYIEIARYGDTNYVAIGFSIATVLALILFTCYAFIKNRVKWVIAPLFLAMACASLALKASFLPFIAIFSVVIGLSCIIKKTGLS